MIAFHVEMSAEARSNVHDIYHWIADSSPTGAIRWLAAFEDAITRLERLPLSYGLAPESAYAPRELRQILFKTRRGRVYRAVYYVAGEVVTITHVRGPRQRLIPQTDFSNE